MTDTTRSPEHELASLLIERAKYRSLANGLTEDIVEYQQVYDVDLDKVQELTRAYLGGIVDIKKEN